MKYFFLFFAASLSAAPIGNPASPALLQQGLFIPDTTWCQPKVSFLEDFTTQVQLDCNASPVAVQKTTMKGNAQLGCLTWSIDERFDASIILGSGSNHLKVYEGSEVAEFNTNGGLIWYGQGKLVLIEMKDTAFSLFGEGGGYNWMSGHYSVSEAPVSNADLMMRFWEVGAALTQKIGFFSPYVGVAVLHSRWKVTTPESITFRFIQENPTGAFIGCSISTSKKLLLNAEWRGIIENAWTVTGELRF